MPAEWDKNPLPHRHLKDGDRGADVKALQHAVNVRLKKKKALTRIKLDGEVGPKTRLAYRRAAYLIGLPHNKLTVRCQAIMRKPALRTPEMIARARRNVKEWRSRENGTMGARALKVARSLVGVMEQGGNNNGPVVAKIIRANGGVVGEAWCGDFVAYCYRGAGSKVVQRAWAVVARLGFLTGMSRTGSPRPGDIVCFSFDHTGMFVKDSGASITTIEGNTGRSGAVSDSKTGGDGVYIKLRNKSLVSRYVRVTR